MQIVYIVDEAFTPMAEAWMSFSAADIGNVSCWWTSGGCLRRLEKMSRIAM